MNLLDKINFEGELLKLRKESSDVPGVSEIVEGFLRSYSGHNPLVVAKTFMSSTEKVSYEPKVAALRESIQNEYKENMFGYELSSAYFEIKKMNSPFYESVLEQIGNVLKSESDAEIKTGIKQDLAAHSYIPHVRSLVEFANRYDKELNSTADHYSKPVYSPIYETEKGNIIFNILGTNVCLNEAGDSIIGVEKVEDTVYNTLLEAINTFTFKDNQVEYYNKDAKIVVTENEGKIVLSVNDSPVDLNENWKQHLLMTKAFDVASMKQLNLLEAVINNFGKVVRLDNVKQLHLRHFDNKKVNVLTLENTVAVHKIDTHVKLNKIDVYETANEAIVAVKDFMGYDLSESLKDYLQVEKGKAVLLKEKRAELIERIEFLKGQKTELENSGLTENEGVRAALEHVTNEMNLHTKELEKVTNKLDKVTEKKSNFVDQGFIEGIVKGNPPSSLKKHITKGDEIYIFAEDYTTSGAKDDIIIKLENGKEIKVKKELVSPLS